MVSESSLVNWINTFDLDTVAALDELADGVVLHRVLREIAPDHFPDGALKDSCGSNAILRATNIKKLLRALEGYYRDALLQDLDCGYVDPEQVAQADAAEVSKVVELVLGCAVQCDDKQRYIQRLMKDLDKQSQADLMVLTKQCLSRGEQLAIEPIIDSTLESEGAGTESQVAELQEALSSVRKLQQEVEDLEGSKAEMQGELAAAVAKKDELEHDLTEALEQRTKYEKLYNDLLDDSIKASARQSTKLSSEQADLEMRLAEAEAELGSMRAKLADREGLAGEKRRLLDELQVCKAEVTDLTAEVGRLKGYKDKLAQAGDLRRQLQEKEEESESLIEQLAEKEAEANEHQRQAEDLRKEVLDAKKSLQACQQLLQGLSAPAAGGEAGEGAAGGDEGERRYQLVLSQLQDAQSELRGVKSELERARRELQDFAAQGDAHDDVAGEGASRVDESVEGLGARGKEQDLKKQNARLTVEVRALQAKLASAAGAGGGGRSEELQAALAELKISKEMLAKSEEGRTVLQKRLADLDAAAHIGAAAGGANEEQTKKAQETMDAMRAENAALLQEKNELMGDKVALERQVLQAEKLAWEAQQQMSSQEAMPKEKADDLLMAENHQMRADLADKRRLLARKEEELSEMRRMKNELQLAAAENAQAPLLQQQLREMQRKEEAAAKSAKRSLAAQEREQKMLVSLMYDLGMEMHRTKMYQRANLEKPPLVSWLEQRRRDLNAPQPST